MRRANLLRWRRGRWVQDTGKSGAGRDNTGGTARGGGGGGRGGGRGGGGGGGGAIAADNHKGCLLDACAKLKMKQPTFDVSDQKGPAHRPIFQCVVKLQKPGSASMERCVLRPRRGTVVSHELPRAAFVGACARARARIDSACVWRGHACVLCVCVCVCVCVCTCTGLCVVCVRRHWLYNLIAYMRI